MNKTLNLEDCVTSEIAQKLKEKGYPLLRVIKQRGEPIIYDLPKNHPNWQNCNAYYIPTISQVLKWLREEKNIHIGFGYSPRKKWRHVVMYMDDRFYNKPALAVDGFLNIEQAAIEGIEYVLDNLI